MPTNTGFLSAMASMCLLEGSLGLKSSLPGTKSLMSEDRLNGLTSESMEELTRTEPLALRCSIPYTLRMRVLLGFLK